MKYSSLNTLVGIFLLCTCQLSHATTSEFLLAAPVFSESLAVNTPTLKCDILSAITSSVLESADKYSVKIRSQKSGEVPDKKIPVVKVTYNGVDTHTFNAHGLFNTGSSASVLVEVLLDGKVVKSMHREYNSGLWSGTCGQLEKISKAIGIHIDVWLSKSDFNYVGADIRNFVIDDDFSKVTPEIAAGYEVNYYIDVFKNGDFNQVRQAYAELKWAGISDKRLYDAISKDILDHYIKPDEDTFNRLKYSLLALGMSNDVEHMATLEAVAKSDESDDLDEYAERSIAESVNDKKIVQIAGEGVDSVPVTWRFQKRISNLMLSKDYRLMRVGIAQAIKYYSQDKNLLDVAKDVLLSEFKKTIPEEEEKSHVYAMRDLCILLSTGGSDYKIALLTVAKQATVKDVRRFAQQYYDRMP